MKKIAILTDFSERSVNAAVYGISLASVLRADVVLFNSFLLPSAEPASAQLAWPLEDYEEVKTTSDDALAKLATELSCIELPAQARNFRPLITWQSHENKHGKSLDCWFTDRDIMLLVMGNHRKGLRTLITGNHTNPVLDHASLPVLIVPETASFRNIRKIVFATDLQTDDLDVIQSLTGLASPFDAEILLTHISPETRKNKKHADDFIQLVSNNINYPHIYYRYIADVSVQKGLKQAQDTFLADMLVMVHREKNFITQLLGGSYSQHMAIKAWMPLLIYPWPVPALPVF